MNRLGFWLVSIAIALYVLASCVFVVDQRQVGVLYSFGQIKTVKTEPGLYAKLPKPFENVVFLDKRILTLDGDERGSIQTAEKKNVVVDWLVKWRIVDARQFIRNSGTNTSNVEQRLTSIVQDALNTEITKRSVRAVLSDEREAVMQGVRGHFRPEFLNRLDEILLFRRLSREDLTRIVAVQIRRLQQLLTDKNITLECTPAALEWLGNRGYDPVYGARPLKRLIQRSLQNPLAELILAGKVLDGQTVYADVADGELILRDHPVVEPTLKLIKG